MESFCLPGVFNERLVTFAIPPYFKNTKNTDNLLYHMTGMLFSEITNYDHTYNNTCAASHWLAQLASLLFVLMRLLIATKMASDFGDANRAYVKFLNGRESTN